MTEVRIGRLLAACLHQAIAEELTDRLEFYETWLRSETLRSGAIGLAAIRAVAGFLRTEGEAYDRVMARAGTLAAEWSLMQVSPVRLKVIGWLPMPIRARAAMRAAGAVVQEAGSTSRARARVRRGRVDVDVAASVFCEVRDRPRAPLCAFYLAVSIETLRHFGIAAHGRVERCVAIEPGASCRLVLELDGAVTAVDPAIAA
jgi:alpha-D-ribose 1-methylphosphonate 5-triphosphate synthase subunit PhnG